MKALTVDFQLICQSMRDLAREHNDYYLDKTTAQVIPLSRALIRALTDENLEDRETLPDWDAQMIPLAREIVLAGSANYVRIPEMFGRADHQFRLAFTETLRSGQLRKELTRALRGRGSCRRFKALLKGHPNEGKRWDEFYDNAWKEKITHWLESIGILAFDKRNKRSSAAS